jgi:hypothetical protein
LLLLLLGVRHPRATSGRGDHRQHRRRDSPGGWAATSNTPCRESRGHCRQLRLLLLLLLLLHQRCLLLLRHCYLPWRRHRCMLLRRQGCHAPGRRNTQAVCWV